MRSIYSPRQRQALVAAPVLLIVLTLALSQHDRYNAKMSQCFIYREAEKPPPTWIPIRDSALHNYSVYVMWGGMLLLALLPHQRAAGLFALLYSSLWFHVTYVLLAALKARLEDFNCAGRHAAYPNGISGHYCYFLFVSLTIPVLARPRLEANPRAPRPVLAAAGTLLVLYVIGASATLYRTFAHGYHSMQQIFLGSALGLFAHISLEFVMLSGIVTLNAGAQIGILISNSILAFSMYYAWWPTERAGPAITTGHVYFHLGLYVLLFLAVMLLPNEETSKSPDGEGKSCAAKA